MTKHKRFQNCLRDINSCIEGDSIYIECRKPSNWKLFQMTAQHKGSSCNARKNAKAIILKSYTNVKE